MAGYKPAVAAIEGRMAANWTLSPVAYENSGPHNYAAGQDWLEFSVREGDARLTALPADHPHSTRVSGVIVSMIHIALGRGTQAARTYCDALAALFNPHTPFDGVQCRVGFPTPIGQQGQHWTMRFTIPFFYSTSP
jgi:hypothetical protein